MAARHEDGVRSFFMLASPTLASGSSPRPARKALGAGILVLAVLAAPDLAHAYIGPGAGYM